MKNYYGVLDGLLLTSLLVFIGTARHFDDSGQSVIRQWPFQRPLPAQNLLINCDNEIEEMQRQQSFLIQDVQSRAKLRDLPEKRFGLAHLLPFFNVNPISEHILEPRLQELLGRNVLKDNVWSDEALRVPGNGADNDLLSTTTSAYSRTIEGRRFYAKWISKDVGYSIVAAVHFEQNEIIDVYCGEICTGTISGDYAEEYLRLKHMPDFRIFSNALHSANLIRFLNDNRNGTNTLTRAHVYAGKWYSTVYTARPILKGEQITLSYGTSYWKDPSRFF